MAKIKRQFIILSFVISFVSTIIAIAAISTDFWVNFDNQKEGDKAEVNYGLFNGHFNYYSLNYYKDIKITCLIDENICGWSYKKSSEERYKEIKELFEGKCNNQTENDVPESKCDLKFLNAGLWLCTLLFIFISLFLSIMVSILTIYNIYANPTNDYFSIWGLKIWNGVCSAGYLITLVMWGAEFGQCISKNIAISDTLKGVIQSEGYANLGFSYWILLIPMLLHSTNIGVLFWRDRAINQEPPIPTIEIDPQKDGLKFLY